MRILYCKYLSPSDKRNVLQYYEILHVIYCILRINQLYNMLYLHVNVNFVPIYTKTLYIELSYFFNIIDATLPPYGNENTSPRSPIALAYVE
jgi:hypothetical protein